MRGRKSLGAGRRDVGVDAHGKLVRGRARSGRKLFQAVVNRRRVACGERRSEERKGENGAQGNGGGAWEADFLRGVRGRFSHELARQAAGDWVLVVKNSRDRVGDGGERCEKKGEDEGAEVHGGVSGEKWITSRSVS